MKPSGFFSLFSLLWKFAALVALLMIMTACGIKVDVTKVSGLEESIPYEAVGSGKLVFTRNSTLYIVDANARTSWGLLGELNEAVISPDGRFIAFAASEAVKYPRGIYTLNLSTDERLGRSISAWSCSNPSWTNDSNHILFEEYADGERKVLSRLSLDGGASSTVRLFRHIDIFTSKISASRSDSLVFSFYTSDAAGAFNGGIFTMNLTGTDLTQLTTKKNFQREDSPVWSPDGTRIAYLKSELNAEFFIQSTEIILMERDGRNSQTVVKLPADPVHQMAFSTSSSIAWSPDGTKLAFNLYDGDGLHIYVINTDGTGLTKITSQTGATDERLSWSR